MDGMARIDLGKGLPLTDVTAPYDAFVQCLAEALPAERIILDPLRRLAWGTDASFYRLVPKVVVVVETEDEVRCLLALCHRFRLGVTFRAAGTSLSGQAVSDSVLAVLGEGWNGCAIEDGGERIRLQPGIIGASANRRLAPFGRKIGPDPASIDSCKIGGIAANNASGMCCGTASSIPPIPTAGGALPKLTVPCSTVWPTWRGRSVSIRL
jgi:D-lactate dehydrogenase